MLYHIKDETPEVLPRFKGGEGNFIAATLPPQATIGRHTHEGDSEIIYILSGRGEVEDDGTLLPLQAGDCHYCPKGHTHSLINNSDEDLVFFAVVPVQ